jgi:hypothetical protein
MRSMRGAKDCTSQDRLKMKTMERIRAGVSNANVTSYTGKKRKKYKFIPVLN